MNWFCSAREYKLGLSHAHIGNKLTFSEGLSIIIYHYLSLFIHYLPFYDSSDLIFFIIFDSEIVNLRINYF